MMLDTDRLLTILNGSIAHVYGVGTDAISIGLDEVSGSVIICPPSWRRDLQVWAISVRPGPVPLEIQVIGSLPVEDARFQQAIGDLLGGWAQQPELFYSRELSVLEQLRETPRRETRHAL